MPAVNGRVSLLPLGGVGAIGMNGLVVNVDGRRWLVDCGVMFPDDGGGGVALVLPDLGWFRKHRDSFAGMVLTHGHEDHIGAVAFVLQVAPMPVWGSRFTLELVKRRLEEHRVTADLRVLEVEDGLVRPAEQPEVGFRLIRVTHSIPDAASLVIETPVGRVLHTADFKIDERPMDGQAFDREAFRQLGDEGVLLMLADSTNAQVEGWSRSESEVVDGIEDVVRGWDGRVLVTQFASNVHRLRGMEQVAARCGRRLCLVGRSLETYSRLAQSAGLASVSTDGMIAQEKLGNVSPREVMVVMTGSQGERRAALYKASVGQHRWLRIDDRDLVVLSSRIIPGNERSVYRIVGNIARLGAKIVLPRSAPVHASGHAHREELREMLRLVRPKMFVPVHGEFTFLQDHAALAREEGVQKTMVIENGQEVALEEDGIEVVREHVLEQWFFDGAIVGTDESLGLERRRRMAFNGAVAAHVTLEGSGGHLEVLVDVRAEGITGEDGILDRAATEIAVALAATGKGESEEGMEDLVRILARRFFRKTIGKKPEVMTFITDRRA